VAGHEAKRDGLYMHPAALERAGRPDATCAGPIDKNWGRLPYTCTLVPKYRYEFDLVQAMKKSGPRAGAGTRRQRPSTAGVFPDAADAVVIRRVRRGDLDQVIDIDATVTGLEKRAYWATVYRRYGSSQRAAQQFLVAVIQGHVVGFVIGEIRDWEFGSPPCGWVFAIDVDPRSRLGGVGTRLLEAISSNFRSAGVRKLRTLLALDNPLILKFFRSQGMMSGPLISLEMDLDG
jgi:GNAT superfamily N-acetyltransferase